MNNLSSIINILRLGGLIIYPTESVLGLGCDPFQQTAVELLLRLKQRDRAKGLILLASTWSQLQDYIQTQDLSLERLTEIQKSENITWVFPKTEQVPEWLSGTFDTIAVRVSSHRIARQICDEFGGPIVSTSANVSGEEPSKDFTKLNPILTAKVDAMIEDSCGPLTKATEIRDALTNRQIR